MDPSPLDYAPAATFCPRWARIARRIQLLLSALSLAAIPSSRFAYEWTARLPHSSRATPAIAAASVGAWGQCLGLVGFLLGFILSIIVPATFRYRFPIQLSIAACLVAMLANDSTISVA
jgi:hypothetical protein